MKKSIALRLVAFPAFAAATGSVFAAVPVAVTTAIDGMATDGAVIAGAVLVAIIAIVAIKFLRKAF